MNVLNTARQRQVINQLMDFQTNDATPTTDFSIKPEYTLIAHLPEDICAKLQVISKKLQDRFPEHYYYTPEQYHLTVVPIHRDLEVKNIIELLEPLLREWRLPIEARGLAVNRFQSGVVLYPEEESLVDMRQKLREALDMPTQSYANHRPVWEELLWANILRFQEVPSEEMLQQIRSYATDLMGSFVLNKFELYDISTKTLELSSSRLLYTFKA